VFGRVIHGFEVLDLMEKVSLSSNFYFFNDWVEAQGEPQTIGYVCIFS
jgi:hypothetical protein